MGDQSEYLRKKMAERRATYEQGGQFMKSGFQRWAETERPARRGGPEKEALATSSTGAGKDILDRVKSMGEEMFAKYYTGTARHIKGDEPESEEESEEERDMGGRMGSQVKERPTGFGRLDEHAADLMKMAQMGKGKLECVHHEDGEGTVVKKKGKGSLYQPKRGGPSIPRIASEPSFGKGGAMPPSMAVYTQETMGKGRPGAKPRVSEEERKKVSDAQDAIIGRGKKTSARAAIVKKVMKEKGLSLIEASKYVKAHGLYKA